MKEKVESIAYKLQIRILDIYPDWGLYNLKLASSGTEFLVFKGDTKALGSLALRVVRVSGINDPNDPPIEARLLLKQEAVLASHVISYGVPAPEIHALHLGDDGFDFLASDYIAHDCSEPDAIEFGRLIRTIHDCPIPPIFPVMQTQATIQNTIAERLQRRLLILEEKTGIQFNALNKEKIAASLFNHRGKTALLHLDARSSNILTSRKTILAIVDWSNSLIGDPSLELARIAEYGYNAQDGVLSSTFLEGYGDKNCLTDLPFAVELIYRLDTAVMLTVLFSCALFDTERAKRLMQRVQHLYAQLLEVI